ncbi:MAG: response regulator [Spirochaetales bacterium]|nr:response regulator [Spirochaetales bacterium]
MEKDRIVIIDDSQTSIALLSGFLGKDYLIESFTDSREGLKRIEEDPIPNLFLLDVQMPHIDGFTLCERIRKSPRTTKVPVIFITSLGDTRNETLGLQLGADDYLVKPLNPGLTRVRVKQQLELQKARKELQNQTRELEKQVQARTLETNLVQDVTIECMATLAEKRDNDGGLHITRISDYIKILSIQLVVDGHFPELDPELNPGKINMIAKAAMLHDIGKVGIPDSILQKKEELTDEEFELLKEHTKMGRDALLAAEKEMGTTSYLSYAREIAYSHHERWDGSGYPEGLVGEKIPLPSRLMAIADVYDNLITSKNYKTSQSHRAAVEFIRDRGEGLFDPRIREAFMKSEEKIRRAALENYDDEIQRQALMIPYGPLP